MAQRGRYIKYKIIFSNNKLAYPKHYRFINQLIFNGTSYHNNSYNKLTPSVKACIQYMHIQYNILHFNFVFLFVLLIKTS